MRTPLPFRYLFGFGLLCAPFALCAQSPSTYSVRVAGLTSDERDAVVRQLAVTGEARVVFACVPAGIMVLAPTSPTHNTTARSQALAAIGTRVPAQRITEVQLSLADAEAACAKERRR